MLDSASDIGARAGVELAILWLNTKDPVEREFYFSMYTRIVKKRELMDANQAVEIANAVGKLFKT